MTGRHAGLWRPAPGELAMPDPHDSPIEPSRPGLSEALEQYYNRSSAYQKLMRSHDARYFESYVRLLAGYTDRASSLLDAGCGAGHSTFRIAESFPHLTCIGVDIARASIDHASHAHRLPNLRFEVGTLAALTYGDGTFSICAAFDCLEHVPDLPMVLPELMRVLVPGGYLIIKGPNHLSPVTTLADTMRLRHRYPFTRSWLDNFPRLAFETRHLVAGWLGRVDFVEREPDLSDSVRVGDDADAVNEMSNLYLRNYLRRAGWKVLNIAWPRSWTRGGRWFARVLPSCASMGIVARKPEETADGLLAG